MAYDPTKESQIPSDVALSEQEKTAKNLEKIKTQFAQRSGLKNFENQRKYLEPENIESAEKEEGASRNLENIRRNFELRNSGKKEGIKSKLESTKKQYASFKKYYRAIKLAFMAGTSLGDIFFSLWGLFFSINLEYVYSKKNKNYSLEVIDKMIFILGWMLILAVFGIITVLVMIIVMVIMEIMQALSFFGVAG